MAHKADRKKRKDTTAWLSQILPFLKDGVRKLNIDDICRYLSVSKATFYKSFSTKDDFLEAVLDDCIEVLRIKHKELANPKIDFGTRYINFIFGVFELSQSLSVKLMADIKSLYPVLFKKIQDFIQSCDTHFITFTKEGIKRKILRDYDPFFITSFNRVLISEFTQPEFLMSNNMTFQQAYGNLIRLNLDAVFNDKSDHAKEIRNRILKEMSQVPNIGDFL